MDITNYIKAAYPVLWIQTHEEGRAELNIVNTAKKLNRQVIFWSITTGFFQMDGKFKDQAATNPQKALLDALARCRTKKDGSLMWVFRDIHPYLKEPVIRRLIRDVAKDFKQVGDCLIMLSPLNEIPLDIKRDVTLIEFELPKYDEVAKAWDVLSNDYQKALGMSEDKREHVIQSAMGLTTIEAEGAFSKAIVEHLSEKDKEKRKDVGKLVLREKAQIVKKSGILEYFETDLSIASIGGLETLKNFLLLRRSSFTKKAKLFGLPIMKGIVLVGLPGCGKSLSAKVASSLLEVPLIKFDIGRCFAGHVGESEANVRLAIQTIEAVGSCVVWMDEIEKGFAGSGTSANDGGVTKRLMGEFLTWMQEKEQPAFTIATMNKIDEILATNPELLRKGRFDEIFFVDLPTPKEREEIFNIHIKRRWLGKKAPKVDLAALAKASDQFSGAEIEGAVKDSLYFSFAENDNPETAEFTTEHILRGIKACRPLAISAAAQLKTMITWARENALPASVYEDERKDSFSRKLTI